VVYPIRFGGAVEEDGAPHTAARAWHAGETVLAVAYDTPVVGWRGEHVNTLRLWSARAADPLRLDAFNEGDYVGALAHRARAEAISRILYPSDATPAGQELRLRQEYFFTSGSLQDLLRRHLQQHEDVRTLPDHVAIQLNDTHPAIAVAELMRLLLDEHALAWEDAWRITTNTLHYTNHTLLPEALETWPVSLMRRCSRAHGDHLPDQLAHLHGRVRAPDRADQIAGIRSSTSSTGKRVRMGHSPSSVAQDQRRLGAAHDLIRQSGSRPERLYPAGSPTRPTDHLPPLAQQANPADRLLSRLGESVLDDASRLEGWPLAGTSLPAALRGQRRANKEALAAVIADRIGVAVDPAALFDVQIKRIHEYKRQLLKPDRDGRALPRDQGRPRRRLDAARQDFAGKAAASYGRRSSSSSSRTISRAS
jgi:starch phosphorylase